MILSSALSCPQCRHHDPDTGALRVLKMIYRAGTRTPHTTPAPTAFPRQRLLRTEGTFGPGSRLVPGGHHTAMASAAGDCTFLFITDKPFDIHYVDKD